MDFGNVKKGKHDNMGFEQNEIFIVMAGLTVFSQKEETFRVLGRRKLLNCRVMCWARDFCTFRSFPLLQFVCTTYWKLELCRGMLRAAPPGGWELRRKRCWTFGTGGADKGTRAARTGSNCAANPWRPRAGAASDGSAKCSAPELRIINLILCIVLKFRL